MKFDISKWELFDFIKIFDIKKGFYNKKPESDETGTIPFLGATDSNNGVTGYYTYEEIESSSRTGDEPNESIARKLFPGNAICVTNNGSVGYAYYQDNEFTCSHDVNPLYLRDGKFNKYTGLFVASVIMHDRYRWGYGRKWRPARMVKSQIKLPVLYDKNGNPIIDSSRKYSDDGFVPDWQFMEDYMKSLHYKTLTTQNKPHCTQTLEICKWKNFITEHLFSKMENGKANQQMLDKGDECFYVGAKRDDNGVMLHCAKENSLITKGNCVVFICNGQGSVGYANYMDADFIGTTDIVAGYNDCLNKYTGIFLATIYSLERPKYSFGRKWKTHLKQTEVSLPIKHNSDGSVFIDKSHKYSDEGFVPDWQFMEDYIKTLPYGDRI